MAIRLGRGARAVVAVVCLFFAFSIGMEMPNNIKRHSEWVNPAMFYIFFFVGMYILLGLFGARLKGAKRRWFFAMRPVICFLLPLLF